MNIRTKLNAMNKLTNYRTVRFIETFDTSDGKCSLIETPERVDRYLIVFHAEDFSKKTKMLKFETDYSALAHFEELKLTLQV